MSLREGWCLAARSLARGSLGSAGRPTAALPSGILLSVLMGVLSGCGAPFEGDPPLSLRSTDETQETHEPRPLDQSLADAESAASQPELQPQAGALQSETDAQQLETEARQSQSLSAKDLKRRADTFIDEPIPPPAGLIDQSRLGAGFEQQGLGDQSSGYTSPESRYRMNERFRNRIDELKRRLADMVDGSEKEQLLGELDEAYDGYRATRDGLIDTGTVMGGEEARGMTKPQRKRLLGLMADYDMSKPSDVAKWNQLKSEELGR